MIDFTIIMKDTLTSQLIFLVFSLLSFILISERKNEVILVKNKKELALMFLLFDLALSEAERIIEKELDRDDEKCDQKFIDNMIDLVDTSDIMLEKILKKLDNEKAEK